TKKFLICTMEQLLQLLFLTPNAVRLGRMSLTHGAVLFVGLLITLQAQTPVARPRLAVRRTSDFEVSGKGDNAAWQQVDWTPLARRQADGHPYDARFKALYSDTGLYFLMDATDKTLTATMTEDFMD